MHARFSPKRVLSFEQECCMPSEELEVNVVPGVKLYAPGTMSTYNPPFGQSATVIQLRKRGKYNHTKEKKSCNIWLWVLPPRLLTSWTSITHLASKFEKVFWLHSYRFLFWPSSPKKEKILISYFPFRCVTFCLQASRNIKKENRKVFYVFTILISGLLYGANMHFTWNNRGISEKKMQNCVENQLPLEKTRTLPAVIAKFVLKITNGLCCPTRCCNFVHRL